MLLLSACTGAGPGYPPESGPGALSASPSGAATGPGAPSLAALPPPGTPINPPSDVQQLVGLKGEALRRWMGKTVFVRQDGIAEIWRFAADTCFLDVFLYREHDGLRVAHLDARSRNGNQSVQPQTCYSQILAAQKPS
jgi:hypothetical protein